MRADLQVVKRSVRRTWFPAQKRVAEWMGDVRTRRPGRYLIPIIEGSPWALPKKDVGVRTSPTWSD